MLVIKNQNKKVSRCTAQNLTEYHYGVHYPPPPGHKGLVARGVYVVSPTTACTPRSMGFPVLLLTLALLAVDPRLVDARAAERHHVLTNTSAASRIGEHGEHDVEEWTGAVEAGVVSRSSSALYSASSASSWLNSGAGGSVTLDSERQFGATRHPIRDSSPSSSSSRRLRRDRVRWDEHPEHQHHELFAFGANRHGELGLGHFKDSVKRPTLVSFLAAARVTVASFGGGRYADGHLLVLTDTGHLFARGDNVVGQLGQGDVADREELAPVFRGVAGVFSGASAGSSHSLAVTTKGVVYAWGSDAQCQLGQGDAPRLPSMSPSPLAVHLVHPRGGNVKNFAKDVAKDPAVGVAAGYHHSMAGPRVC